MEKSDIENKLKQNKLFSCFNEEYTRRLIQFLNEDTIAKKQFEKGDVNSLFNIDNSLIIRNLFSDIQADGNIWHGTKELTELVNIDYDEDNTIDHISCLFLAKLRKLFQQK